MELMIGVLLALSVIPILAWLGNGLQGTKVYDMDNAALVRALKKSGYKGKEYRK